MFKYIEMTQSCRLTQGGSALIVALVFLLVMTLIGTTAMQGTTQQERMAGNYLDHMMAFQATEGALSMARKAMVPLVPNALDPPPGQQLGTWWQPTTPSPPPTPPSCDPTQPSLNPPQPCSVGQNFGNLSSPMYVIEKLSGLSQSGSLMCRYTARVTGGSGSAEVILEAVTECG
ncbi:MAG: hypothetical protein LM550_17305 [Candidatus Contendobacter sp.]|nr:hypothetical protein [Candidatus Contendobacter sp.]